jgi:hypothetical protein
MLKMNNYNAQKAIDEHKNGWVDGDTDSENDSTDVDDWSVSKTKSFEESQSDCASSKSTVHEIPESNNCNEEKMIDGRQNNGWTDDGTVSTGILTDDDDWFDLETQNTDESQADSPFCNTNTTITPSSTTRSKSTNAILFNVGGSCYEVSESLLDEFSDTVLAKLAKNKPRTDAFSKTIEPAFQNAQYATKDNGDDDKNNIVGGMVETVKSAIEELMTKALSKVTRIRKANNREMLPPTVPVYFPHGNGHRFKYCLEYMTNGGMVALPRSISRDAFLCDLARYGVTDVNPACVFYDDFAALHPEDDFRRDELDWSERQQLHNNNNNSSSSSSSSTHNASEESDFDIDSTIENAKRWTFVALLEHNCVVNRNRPREYKECAMKLLKLE